MNAAFRDDVLIKWFKKKILKLPIEISLLRVIRFTINIFKNVQSNWISNSQKKVYEEYKQESKEHKIVDMSCLKLKIVEIPKNWWL